MYSLLVFTTVSGSYFKVDVNSLFTKMAFSFNVLKYSCLPYFCISRFSFAGFLRGQIGEKIVILGIRTKLHRQY